MNPLLDRRQVLGWMGAGTAVTALPLGALRADTATTLRNLRWDRKATDAIWEAPNGPKWVVHDDMAMYWGGGRALQARCPPLATPLSAVERADINAALTASSAYYRALGLWPPELPIGDDNAFHIFYVDAPEGISGGTGPAAGDPVAGPILGNVFVLVETQIRSTEYVQNNPARIARLVPEGVHMMLSGPVFRAYRRPPDNDHRWAPQITLAHELVHAMDQNAPGMSGWGEVDGWCVEGSIHAIAQFALRRIGYDPVKSYATGVRSLVKDIGLRPYDVTLTLRDVPRRIPMFRADELRKKPGEPIASDQVQSFWKKNATYLTCSFWRFLFQEEAPVRLFGPANRGQPGPTKPGDFELFPLFRAFKMTDEDRARAAANSRWIDPVLVLLDRFLKTHHPTWGIPGLYRAFPAFIAHFVEWPDQVAEGRKGFLAHDKWLNAMFMDGVPLFEIDAGRDIIYEPEMIPPYAARALRFKLPPFEQSGFMMKYPRVTITVTTLNGPRDAIDHIHIGLRGNVLGNLLSQPVRSGAGRVRRWTDIDASPLFESRTNGESVLTIINAPPAPERGRPLKVRVHIAVQVAGAFGQCSYHPLPVQDENGRMVTLPSSVSPPTKPEVPVLIVERGIDEIGLTIVQDADFVIVASLAAEVNPTALGVERKSERRQGDAGGLDSAFAQAAMARLANPSGKKGGLAITLILPRVEAGVLGPVSGARVEAEWGDPVYIPFERYGVSTNVRMETDAVQVELTANSEGTLVGTYAADFDAASDNSDRVFRGRISGKFSTGVIKDEAQDTELPKDRSAILPTDIFIGMGRSGMDVASMRPMLDAAMSAAGGDTQGGASGGTPNAAEADMPGAQLLYSPQCPKRSDSELRMAIDRYLSNLRDSVPGITPDYLREMREALLADPEAAAMLLCNNGF